LPLEEEARKWAMGTPWLLTDGHYLGN